MKLDNEIETLRALVRSFVSVPVCKCNIQEIILIGFKFPN